MRSCLLMLTIVTAIDLSDNLARADGAFGSAASFRCKWSKGTMYVVKSGKFESWDFRTENPENQETIYDNLDRVKQTGRMIGGRGAGDIIVVPGPNCIHMIEPTAVGMSVTTIFEVPLNGEYFAIYSRHMMLASGLPMPSTYIGTCRVWNSNQ